MPHTFKPNVAALLPTKQGRITIGQRPIPTPGEGELLVRNMAVAANPSDWKVQSLGILITEYPAVLGSDLAGIVDSVGPGVTRFKAGDRVVAFATGVIQRNSDKAAFQTYTLVDEVSTTHLPDNIAFEEGAVLPVGIVTASIALFKGLGLPMCEKSVDGPGAILIWSGASSVGVSAVQIANSLGWPVYVTASPKHHEWLKTMGAVDAWDYRDPQVAQKIAQTSKSSGLEIRGVVDARSDETSFNSVAEILATADTAPEVKLTTLAPWPADKTLPRGVELYHTNCSRLTTDYLDIASWLFGRWLSESLKDGRIKPVPRPRIFEGGLEATQEMLTTLKSGASGEKFVLKV
ncbi:oxidoreductase [Fusarium beomiforme]|uniref:Oxidoreductase n=1 Tax=Fusarium beomiforme TaxID=44412 RepID=A0A9P5E6W9_9HYPO|nr:oxidoreductase [Fusarium beomiforme]